MTVEIAFVDTNLFIRYFTDDDPIQSNIARRLFQQAAEGDLLLVAHNLIIAEIIWVLDSIYHLDRTTVSDYIFAILSMVGLKIEATDVIVLALDFYVNKNVDFVDAYSLSWMRANELSLVYTFDQRHFSGVEGIKVRLP
jgi:predicted nucleic-acid-binding protein